MTIEEQPIISTPHDRNGKKWWQEVWGKVTAGLLLIAIPTVSAWVYFKTVAAYAATVEVYRTPPRVNQLRIEVNELKANRAVPMPPDLEADLRAFLKKQKAKP